MRVWLRRLRDWLEARVRYLDFRRKQRRRIKRDRDNDPNIYPLW
jgi:hypothetical protein